MLTARKPLMQMITKRVNLNCLLKAARSLQNHFLFNLRSGSAAPQKLRVTIPSVA
jgi:hypothetical protein